MPPDAGPAGGEEAAFVQALRRGGTLAGVHDGHGRPADDRLAVYRNTVIVSLRDALRTAFPVTERLAGADFFAAAAVDFARAEKPRSPVLLEYGEAFPAFLAGLPGLAPYPVVPEVAVLEWARLRAYHAADAGPLASDALGAVAPEALPGLVLAAHPATRLVPLPAGGYAAYRTEADGGLPEAPEAAAALVTRPLWRVLLTPLCAAEARFAGALLAARPLEEALREAGEDFALTPALAKLISAGAFATLHEA